MGVPSEGVALYRGVVVYVRAAGGGSRAAGLGSGAQIKLCRSGRCARAAAVRGATGFACGARIGRRRLGRRRLQGR